MKLVSALGLLAITGLVSAQEWQITFYDAGDCTGNELGSFGDSIGNGACMDTTAPPLSVYFDFIDTNGNGYGNFYANTDNMACEPDGTSPGEDLDTCYAPSASGCRDFGSDNDDSGYTYDGANIEGDCVVLPPRRRSPFYNGSLRRGA